MSSMEYLEKMTNIQRNLLDYIDDEDVSAAEDKFYNFKHLISKSKIQDNQHEFKSFLHLLAQISSNHHRTDNFFNKIDRILTIFKDDLQKYFSNSQLFNIFKGNKRILLFLIEEKIMNFDEFVARGIINFEFLALNYPQYFQPEISGFMKKDWFPKYIKIEKEEEEEEYDSYYDRNKWVLQIQQEIPKDFYQKRKFAVNESFFCSLIRKDLLDDFIVYSNKKNYQLDSIIKPSIYETNYFLQEKDIQMTLIEYAAFFGSIKIFNYLRLKNISLKSSIWKYAICGNNAEIIQILEENHIELPEDESYKKLFEESIKCHHNEIAYYIKSNYLEDKYDIEEEGFEIIYALKFYNFIFIKNEEINETTFKYLCQYDYYILVSILLNSKVIDINRATFKIIIYLTIKNGNIEIVDLLLSLPNIDVNWIDI